MKLTFPCCRRLCPEMRIVEHWVMEQLARWNCGLFRFGQKLFSVNWPLCVVPNYIFQKDETFVERPVKLLRNHSAMSRGIYEYA